MDNQKIGADKKSGHILLYAIVAFIPISIVVSKFLGGSFRFSSSTKL